jgi:hypothetical protein
MTAYFIRVYDLDGITVHTTPDFEAASVEAATYESARIAREHWETTGGQIQGALVFRSADRQAVA